MPNRPSLAAYLADAPSRGFSVAHVDARTWVLVDAYGDGSTDEAVHLNTDNTYTVATLESVR